MPDNEHDDVTEADRQETEEDSGTTYPGADPEDAEQIEEDRQERLDPENRPDNAEVDNSEREFDAEKGLYKDSEGYDEAEKRFPPSGSQGA